MILHIVDAPLDIEWRECRHKPTRQRCAVLPCGGTVETQHGTMSFRVGDVLIEGANGTLYAISAEAFGEAYDVE